MWCRSHHCGGWVQPGKEHPASRRSMPWFGLVEAIRRFCLMPRGPLVVDDGGPDVGFVGDPAQLIGAELGAVSGFGQPSFGQQVVECRW